MKVFAQNLIVDRDMVTKPCKQVWPWEVPLLEAKFGEGRVRLMDITEVEVEKLPEAADEFARLGRAFGVDGGDGGTNIAYVELAYGRGRAGVAELAKAIKASTKKKRKPPKKAVDKAAESKADEPEAPASDEGDPLDLG